VLAELLFLEASDEVLASRYRETRRVHPAARETGMRAAIAEERNLLRPLAERADVVVDTSAMSVHDLKRFVTRHYTGRERGGPIEIELVSFGFRYGGPEAADLVLDVRFLPNPHFEPNLREFSGEKPAVAAYVLDSPRSRAFLERLDDFLGFLVPLYEEEGKAYLTIAIGCTGGVHRSVAVVRALEAHLRERKMDVRVTHRDMTRPGRTKP
jgi:UPF0042 nucleotide-binding protein